MTDLRPVGDIVDEQRQQALEKRLRLVTAAGDLLTGVQVVTARDIEEVFAEAYEADYSHKAEVETPATLVVDVVCLNCHMTLPDVPATITSRTVIEKEGVWKVGLRLNARAQTHACGQMSVRDVSPAAEPEVPGQAPAFEDDDLLRFTGEDDGA